MLLTLIPSSNSIIPWLFFSYGTLESHNIWIVVVNTILVTQFSSVYLCCTKAKCSMSFSFCQCKPRLHRNVQGGRALSDRPKPWLTLQNWWFIDGYRYRCGSMTVVRRKPTSVLFQVIDTPRSCKYTYSSSEILQHPFCISYWENSYSVFSNIHALRMYADPFFRAN